MTFVLQLTLAFAAGNSFIGALSTAAFFAAVGCFGLILISWIKLSISIVQFCFNISVILYCLCMLTIKEADAVLPFFWYTSNIVFIAAFVINYMTTLIIPFNLAKKILLCLGLLAIPCLALFGPLQASALLVITLAMYWQSSSQRVKEAHV